MKNWIFALFVLPTLFSCGGDKSPAQIEEQQPDFSDEVRKEYLEKGKKIAQESFQVLSGKLQKEIAEVGIVGAIDRCNIHAASAIDSISSLYNVSIKRTALRVRNQGNKATDEEKHLLKLFDRALGAKEVLNPMLMFSDSNRLRFYSPIMMKPLCLNCHGEPGNTMSEEVYEKIIEKYPLDKAIGYELGDFRGLWSIEFKE